MEDLILVVCLSGVVVIWILEKFLAKKIAKYEVYLKYVTVKMIEKADETFDSMDKSGKHSYVAKKIAKVMPTWLKGFISEEKIDSWIHEYVHSLRQKQKEVVELTTRAVTTDEAILNMDNERLISIINEAKKSAKITVEPMIDLEKFKKSKIGIKFEKMF
jgi:hypothetical protein